MTHTGQETFSHELTPSKKQLKIMNHVYEPQNLRIGSFCSQVDLLGQSFLKLCKSQKIVKLGLNLRVFGSCAAQQIVL